MEQYAFPSRCEHCDMDGDFYTNFSPEEREDHYIRCLNCGKHHANIRCRLCRSNGDFVEVLEERPAVIICPICSMEKTLPSDYYQKIYDFKPIKLNSNLYGGGIIALFAGMILAIGLLSFIR